MGYAGATCLAFCLVMTACKSSTSGQSAHPKSSTGAKKKTTKPAATSDSGSSSVQEGDAASGAAGGSGDAGMSGPKTPDAGSSPTGDAHGDAGGMDAGSHPSADAGSDTDSGTHMDSGSPAMPDAASDSGAAHIGSCCATHTTPGCSNPDLEVCVCSKLVSCCTDAWSAACAMIVKQKYCQPGVHECLCAPDAGSFVQTSCCMDWSDTFCNSVATSQCGAVSGCI